jgi:hypothetical protein
MLLGIQLQREKLRRRTIIGKVYFTKSTTARPFARISDRLKTKLLTTSQNLNKEFAGSLNTGSYEVVSSNSVILNEFMEWKSESN